MNAKDRKVLMSLAVIVILMLTTIFFLKPGEWEVYRANLTSDGCAWAKEEGIDIQPRAEGRCIALLRLKCLTFSDDVSIRRDDDSIAILTGRAFTSVTKASDAEAILIKKTPAQAAVPVRLGWVWLSAMIAILLIWALPPHVRSKHTRR